MPLRKNYFQAIANGVEMAKDSKSEFLVVFHGQVQTALFPGAQDVCVKVSYYFGPDWTLVGGQPDVLSSTCSRGNAPFHVIDLPLEATFSSTNPYRWPQLIVSCYGRDTFGNDIIRGYGAMPIPTTAGRHTRTVPCFIPQPSSLFQRIAANFWGNRAEFVEPSIVATPHGRHAARVSTQGELTITMNLIVKDIKKFGFDVMPAGLLKPSETTLPDYQTKPTKQVNIVEDNTEDLRRPLPQLIEDR